MRRKRTISERVTENGDPLAVRKKAREAAKQGASASANFPATPAHRQPRIEEIDEEDTQPRKAVLKNASRILELADGSEDDLDKDEDGMIAVDDTDDDRCDNSEDGNSDDSDDIEVPAESAEAELGKCLMIVC